MDPVEYLIFLFGSGRKLAAQLGCTGSAISVWKRNGRVPKSKMAQVLKLAEKNGYDVTLHDLENGRQLK